MPIQIGVMVWKKEDTKIIIMIIMLGLINLFSIISICSSSFIHILFTSFIGFLSPVLIHPEVGPPEEEGVVG